MNDTEPDPRLYVLWDVDGTLLRNGINAGGLYQEAIELAIGRTLAHPVPRVHGKTDGQIIWEALAANGLSPQLHPVVSGHLDQLSLDRHLGGSRREIAPGVVEAVRRFGERGFVNALLTGNSANRTRYKMEGAGLDTEAFDWKNSYFGDVAPLRAEITVRAAAELAGHRLVIIGDTPGDGIGADSAGIPFFAVATGHFSADELRETNALLVVDDLASGLPQVLDALVGLGSLDRA
ncbi:HAD hydrolase-like protein [Glaciihabitans sp. UYNi722]|uniref:HAD family hydrolase n=1 Tax=Glaciihabitans sp. UYNi722 TaxID=3156344 RepID=UPI0033992E00